jgi:putative peptidoglycan lipid II flippase
MFPVPQIARMFTGASTNRRIFRVAVSVTLAGILVKVVATFKEIAVARAYGRSDAMDAFLAAMLIPALLINLISESMNQALVPTLIRVKEREGQERAQELLSSSMLWMCVLLASATAIMALTARGFFPLIASHFSPAKLDLSVRIFYALLPVVLITGIATNCTAVLNAFGRFAVPALAVVVNPAAIILGALLLSGRLGIWAVVYATLAGALVHAGVVAGMMESQGFRFHLRWHGMTEATREVAYQYGPVLLSALVASGGLLMDQSMAAMLPAGSVSALVYANRFVSVILTLLAGAVSTAVMPYFSRMIAFEDWAGCRHTVRTWVRLTALVSAPIAIALIAGSHLLIRIALQHGAFGPRDTAVVKPVLAMYAIQIPFFVTSRVFYRFLVAMRRTDLIFYCGAINLVLDIVLNLILMRWFGVAGIALATSLWTVSTFLFLWYWTWRLLPRAVAEDA